MIIRMDGDAQKPVFAFGLSALRLLRLITPMIRTSITQPTWAGASIRTRMSSGSPSGDPDLLYRDREAGATTPRASQVVDVVAQPGATLGESSLAHRGRMGYAHQQTFRSQQPRDDLAPGFLSLATSSL
jgi:hypothetical protein